MIPIPMMSTSTRKEMAKIILHSSHLDWMRLICLATCVFKQLQVLQKHAIYESFVPCALSLAPGSVSVTVSLTVIGSSKSMIYKIITISVQYLFAM
jgi:hypothetical protein